MSDDATINSVLAGNTDEFATLVDRHHARCLRVAYRILGNREDAEEAVQDAFVRAYKALATYQSRERFAAWLSRILVNQCRSVLAQQSRRSELLGGLDPVSPFCASPLPGDVELLNDLDNALAQLPAEQREAVVLRYADDLTYDEMSRITGAGTSALKMRVQRAFVRLRSLLTEVSLV